MGTVVKQVYTEQVYDQLRADIIQQAIPCGQKLNISELAKRFDVSASPIREAIGRLQQEGLVQYVPNLGARVITLDDQDIIEIQDIQILLDCGAMRLALKQQAPKFIASELLKYIEKHRCSSPKERVTASSQFHEVFYKYANNLRLQKLREQTGGQVQILRTVYENQLSNLLEDSGLNDHIKIYEAILVGDIELAATLLRNHHQDTLTILLKSRKPQG